MNKRYLIINADDFNITDGVSRAIIQAAHSGVVTSTSVLINVPIKKKICDEIKKISHLSIGLHFNITYGRPVSKQNARSTLLMCDGMFMKAPMMQKAKIRACDIVQEFDAQFKAFVRTFRKKPSHIDSHHHIHNNSKIYNVLAQKAIQHKIALRRCSRRSKKQGNKEIVCTRHMISRFNPKDHWKQRSLINAVRTIKKGTTELIVHPGFSDSTLRKISSFSTARENECRALMAPAFKKALDEEKIILMNYNDLHTINDMGYEKGI